MTGGSLAMATLPLSTWGTFEKLTVLSVFVWAPLLYMLPTIEAFIRGHNNKPGIAVLNVFLGWTLIGWVAALVWALKRPTETASAPLARAVSQSSADELEKLAALVDRGALTEEEFKTEKAKILART